MGTFHLEEKSSCLTTQGIVEEFSDGESFAETRSQKLSISRGVSIVSLSEDERPLSRDSSGNNVLLESNFKVDHEDNLTIKRESSLKEEEAEIEPKAEETPSVTLKLHKRPSLAQEGTKTEEKNVEKSQKAEIKPCSKEIEVKIEEASKKVDAKLKEIDRDSKIASSDTQRSNSLDEGDDPEVDKLLRRIKEQRSVLQEILNKEAASSEEGTYVLGTKSVTALCNDCSEEGTCVLGSFGIKSIT